MGNARDFFVLMPRFFTAAGREGFAADTRFCVSIFALSRLVPTSKDTCIVVVPSLALIDCMYNMFSTPFTCCSMGVATACSTFSAFAPLYEPVIFIMGGVISGYWLMGTPFSVINPMIMVKMEITIATIGLLIKNSLIKCYWKLSSSQSLIFRSGIIVPFYNSRFYYYTGIYKRASQDHYLVSFF